MTRQEFVTVKYGGSNYLEPGDYHAVVEHQNDIYKSGKIPICVNSARKGASDRLAKVWRGELPLERYVQEEEEFFSDVFRNRQEKDAFMKELKGGFAEMKNMLNGSSGKYSDTHRESYVISHGETETGKAMQYLLSDQRPGIRFLDGRQAGVVAKSMRGDVDIMKSVENIKKNKGNFCYGGFVGMDPSDENFYMLLCRDSTDITAALVAAAYDSNYWNIKDVDGIYRCDPSVMKKNQKPPIIEKLSYGEAASITQKGSPVIHSSGIIISEGYGVDIVVKSINGKGNGTRITHTGSTTKNKPFAALSSGIYGCATINDKAMLSEKGYLAEVADILARNNYNIIVPSGPGTSISFVVSNGDDSSKNRGVDVDGLWGTLTRGLRERGRNAEVKVREIATINIVGDEMRERPGTLSKISGIMGREKINMYTISTPDEKHVNTPEIGFSVNPEDYERTVNALLEKLF